MFSESELETQKAGLLPGREALGVLRFDCSGGRHPIGLSHHRDMCDSRTQWGSQYLVTERATEVVPVQTVDYVSTTAVGTVFAGALGQGHCHDVIGFGDHGHLSHHGGRGFGHEGDGGRGFGHGGDGGRGFGHEGDGGRGSGHGGDGGRGFGHGRGGGRDC